MRLLHPLVLLLSGILSASSVGCSAVTAVVGDSRTASRQGRGTSERMAAIGRVYETQGRYDQAEIMYRKALKESPGNASARDQLQSIVQRKSGKTFSSRGTGTLVAAATNLSAPSSTAVAGDKSAELGVALAAENTNAVPTTPIALANAEDSFSEVALDVGAISPVAFASVEEPPLNGGVKNASVTSEVSPVVVEPISITAAEILEVVDNPADHAELLLDGLRYGDSLETQCLAATLLGDCDSENATVQKALEIASRSASDSHLRLAISDSRIQRGEHDDATLASLLELIESAPAEVKIQACTDLRHFSGTESESECVTTLLNLLDTDHSELRASSAVTLSDFPGLPKSAIARLSEMAEQDVDSDVREAARATLNRISKHCPESIDAISE